MSFTEGTAGDYPNRYSNGDAYQGSSITTDKLPAGAYKVYVGMRATRETVTATIKNGETELGTVSTSSTAVVNTDITLTSEAALTISGNSKNAEMDYVYIERTGDATKSQTFIFEGAANDFTNAKTFDISATQDNAAKATSVDGTSIFGSISGEGTYKFAVIFTGIASDMTLDSVTIK